MAALKPQVEAGLDWLRHCYDQERAFDPQIERHHMVFVLYVTPTGAVEDVSLLGAVDPVRADPSVPAHDGSRGMRQS